MLDTNACISIINNRPQCVSEQLLKCNISDITISSIVYYELLYGVCKSQAQTKNRQRLMHFLRYIKIMDYAEKAVEATAHIRCELEKKGTPIGSYDLQIAGHAKALDALLITHNTKEFSRVSGLKIQDWEGAAPPRDTKDSPREQ